MRKFRITVHNWKQDNIFTPFCFDREFPSAYFAWRYADRISFNRNSPYVVTVDDIYQEEGSSI